MGCTGADAIDDPLQRADVIEASRAAGALAVVSVFTAFSVAFAAKTSSNCPLWDLHPVAVASYSKRCMNWSHQCTFNLPALIPSPY